MAKSKYLTQIEKIISIIDVQTPYAQDMKKWANFFFKEREKLAHSSVVNVMVEMAGDSVAHLNNEIEKVCLWTGDRDTIFWLEEGSAAMGIPASFGRTRLR